MASKGNKRHTIRFNTPGYMKITRKHPKFFINTQPGPHPKRFSLPLGHILREILKIARTAREAKFILNNREVIIDGKVMTDPRFPVGLMDVLEIPRLGKKYRILPSNKHTLVLSEITDNEAKYKLCKIENITTVKGGNQQLNLHDGRNILIEVKDATKKPKMDYKTNGTLKISIPDQKILDYFPLETGNEAIVYEGANIGHSGKLTNITKRFGVHASLVEVGDISTAYEYIFMIGKDKPSIDLPME